MPGEVPGTRGNRPFSHIVPVPQARVCFAKGRTRKLKQLDVLSRGDIQRNCRTSETVALSGFGRSATLALGAVDGLEEGRAWDGSNLSVAGRVFALATGADEGTPLLADRKLNNFLVNASRCVCVKRVLWARAKRAIALSF